MCSIIGIGIHKPGKHRLILNHIAFAVQLLKGRPLRCVGDITPLRCLTGKELNVMRLSAQAAFITGKSLRVHKQML